MEKLDGSRFFTTILSHHSNIVSFSKTVLKMFSIQMEMAILTYKTYNPENFSRSCQGEPGI